MTYITWVTIVMFSICFHEFAHACMALREGDSTAATAGHLTMNPLKQMGMLSIVMLLVVGISWGAVPVNPYRMRARYSPALVAFAGPAANLFLVLAFSCLYVVFNRQFGLELFNHTLYIGAVLNTVLFLFNLLPVPMLDGWTVFSYLIPNLKAVSGEVRNAVTFIIIMLCFMTPVIGWFYSAGQFVFFAIVHLLGGS